MYIFDPAFPLEELTQLIGHWKETDKKMLLTALSLCHSDKLDADAIHFIARQ